MAEKIIPIAALRSTDALPTIPTLRVEPTGSLSDRLERPLHDLRISVTDRCNFRCVYCMPKALFDKDYQFLPQSALLSFEEIVRIARIFMNHGVQKIRLTGGEPLLRKHLDKLIEMLQKLPTHNGQPLDLTLTTNGALLAKKARALKNAGLKRLTVSLDAIDEKIFRQMNDVDFSVAEVLRGIDAAHAVGLAPIKINMVVKRGMNDQQILPMVRHFRNTPAILRFIEYMDVGTSNGWKMDDVVPSSETIARIDSAYALEPHAATHAGETAARWRYRDGQGEVGVISSVTQAFCHACSRARLSTEGKLYTCLFASSGHDLRGLLRGGHSDAEISAAVAHLWQQRNDRYSAVRSANTSDLAGNTRKVEMSYIGG